MQFLHKVQVFFSVILYLLKIYTHAKVEGAGVFNIAIAFAIKVKSIPIIVFASLTTRFI